MNINIKQLVGTDTVAWDQFVERQQSAKIYHMSAWRGLIERLFGHECHYLYAQDDTNELCGVLPMVRLKSRLFGDYLVSMPYFNYGGVIAANADIAEELMRSGSELADSLGVSHVEFRDQEARPEEWAVKTNKITMFLALPESEDELWKVLGPKRRAQIKRPLRENPEVVFGKGELIDDFYRVFSENMRDLGTPVYSKQFFKEIVKEFPEASKLVVIRLKGKPVGAAFLMSFKGVMEIPWASTIKSVNNLGVNMLMYWEVLKYAINTKHTAFDFGRCTVDSGTYRFKKQWGSEKHQLYWHYHLTDGNELPQLNPDNPKYRLAISMWQRLPLPVANLVGPLLVKNLP